MLVYHTSYCVVENPDVAHSRNYLDFGTGFYITTLREQAERYAERFRLKGESAFLNIYELSDGFDSGNVKKFGSYNEEWLNFVCACRKGEDISDYEAVIGGVANDKVFRTIDLYFSGDITKEQALGKLTFEHINNQICLRSDDAIHRYLKFLKSEEIK